ncbi:MAG: hypothetical protein RL095_440 [Verrucomicrobiota bacterium]|jgi:CRISPR system Cascade subunit CasE
MSHYLSHGRIPVSALPRYCPRDSYAWHQALWNLFPGHNDQSRPFLCRWQASGDFLDLFLLSSVLPAFPDWSQAGRWQSRELPAEFPAARRYRFALTANPSKKLRTDGSGRVSKNGRRVALETQEELQNWLRRKLGASGCQLLGEALIANGSWRCGRRDECTLSHAVVEFQGALEVLDTPLFRQAWRQGFGSAKAFGFGLMLLFPHNP